MNIRLLLFVYYFYYRYHRQISVVCFILISNFQIYAEGTKELVPNPTIGQGSIQIYDRGRLFATYNAPVENRLNIRICSVGEVIHFGFNQTNNDVYFRLKDPNGNIVRPAQLIPTSGAGYIPNHAAAVAGPFVVNPLGYTPLSYTTTMTGDYFIEFNPTSSTTITPVQRIFTFFDITVTSGNNALPGRLWSLIWDINTLNVNNRFYGKMFIYSKDSIVTSVDFNGIQPHGATITANSSGLSNTGNVVVDRASRVGDFSYPEYKIFLNNPDESCFPTGFFGNIIGPSRITGCGDNRCIQVEVNKSGEVELLLDLNGIPGFQANSEDLIKIVQVQAGLNCIPWDARDNFGQTILQNITFPIQINYINGITHLPLFDVEHHRNGYIVELIRPLGNRPNLYWDDSGLNAGTNLDARVNLNGCSISNGCHRWQNRGDNNCSTQCPETINTWWYPNIITDNIQFVSTDVEVDADDRNTPGTFNDTLVCSSLTTLALSGRATGEAVGGLSWIGGAGNFIGGRSIANPIYQPTLQEVALGSIVLYLQTLPSASGCITKRDSLLIRFEQEPSVILPSDTMLCAYAQPIKIESESAIGNSFAWSGGLGTYSDQLHPTTFYTPSINELSSFVMLTLTASGNVCAPVSDQIQLSFLPNPIIQVIDTIRICPSSNAIVSAIVQNTATIEWKNLSNVLSTSTQVTYTPVVSEYIYVTGSNLLHCSVIDSVFISISTLPLSTLLDSIRICENQLVEVSTTHNQYRIEWIRNGSVESSQLQYSYLPIQSEYIYLHIYNTINCQVKDSVYIERNVYPDVQLNDIQTCVLFGNTLNATPLNITSSDVTFQWFKNGSILPDSQSTLVLHDFGTYETIVNHRGCMTHSQSNVIVSDKPKSTLPDKKIYCEDDTPIVTVSTGSHSSYTYDWYPFVGSSASVTISQPGWYKVKISGSVDCYVLDSILLLSVCPPELYTPNAFSPNNDGTNDLFTIYGKHIGKYSLWIYNRWGEIIFKSDAIENVWDGTYLGDRMPIGTYPWMIEYEGDSQDFKGPYRLEGSITIVE